MALQQSKFSIDLAHVALCCRIVVDHNLVVKEPWTSVTIPLNYEPHRSDITLIAILLIMSKKMINNAFIKLVTCMVISQTNAARVNYPSQIFVFLCTSRVHVYILSLDIFSTFKYQSNKHKPKLWRLCHLCLWTIIFHSETVRIIVNIENRLPLILLVNNIISGLQHIPTKFVWRLMKTHHKLNCLAVTSGNKWSKINDD